MIPQTEATVASALAAYRVGGVDFMTLLDNRMTVNKYRQQLFALDAEQGKAWAELEMLVGRELFDPNQAPAVTARTRGYDERASPSLVAYPAVLLAALRRVTSRRAKAVRPPTRRPRTITPRLEHLTRARPVMLSEADARRIGVTFAPARSGR